MNLDRLQQLEHMSPSEWRAAYSLAIIFSLRMLGLFMLLPVFSLYTNVIEGATPLLIGVAIGIYGLTQGVFQIPFGMMSDRFGRKPVILAGLALFALGSVIAATADTMVGLILGRAIQGGGAIAAATMALAADLTRESHRTKAMAVIGMSIGVSFALALVIGPIVNGWLGLSGLFWMTAVLALVGMAVLWFIVPNPDHQRPHRDAQPIPAQFKKILGDMQLLRLDFGILSLHMILTATFIAVPLALAKEGSIATQHHWWVYLPVLVVSVAAMVPFIIMAEKKRRMKSVFLGGILFIGVAEAGLAGFHQQLSGIVISLLVFFTAFNLLEASLPSLVSKMAPPDSKGTAMGFYSSSQFIGAFLGGSLGGAMLGAFQLSGVFLFNMAMACIWLLLASSMRSPRYLTSYLLNVGQVDPQQCRNLTVELTQIRGVAEAIVVAEDQVAYLKVDRKALDELALYDTVQRMQASPTPVLE